MFKHDNELGNAPAFSLFSQISVKRKAGVDVPRSFEDYEVRFDSKVFPIGSSAQPHQGVTLTRMA